jgi:hypothetical protein
MTSSHELPFKLKTYDGTIPKPDQKEKDAIRNDDIQLAKDS